MARKYWPYDEVLASREKAHPYRMRVMAPWLAFSIDVDPLHLDRAQRVADKLGSSTFTSQELDDMSWFFSSLEKFPLSYILPRAEISGPDQHSIPNVLGESLSPRDTLAFLAGGTLHELDVVSFADRVLQVRWNWDLDAALEFSQVSDGFDPESLFSVARRFHLLNDLENNRTSELVEFMRSLKGVSTRFRKAATLIVRQYHYITERQESTLRAALPVARGAFRTVLDFIEAEAGRDRVLARALKELDTEPSHVPVIDATVVLMETFRFIAERNFLAFSMVVELFERTSDKEADAIASLLKEGSELAAGRQIDLHRQINDSGNHENIALGFLSQMAPVTATYARDALRLAELATLVMHQLSAETLSILRAE